MTREQVLHIRVQENSLGQILGTIYQILIIIVVMKTMGFKIVNNTSIPREQVHIRVQENSLGQIFIIEGMIKKTMELQNTQIGTKTSMTPEQVLHIRVQ